MKKTAILSLLIAFATISFSQQVPATTPAPMQTDYLEKSKKQITAAAILLGGGAALLAGGLMAHSSYINNHQDTNPDLTEIGIDTGKILATIGVVLVAGSVPLFIASSNNKKKAKAASVFIDMEKA